VAYARLHTSERFLEQMKKAREEFKAKSKPTAVRPVTTVQQSSAPARVYTLSGAPATDTTSGIVVTSDGRKIVR